MSQQHIELDFLYNEYMEVTLNIPEEAIFQVSEGQKVNIGDPFYTIKKSEDVHIPIAKPLGVKPELIFQYTQVVIGSSVKQGDILASAKKFMGTKKISSNNDGIVMRIDHEEGVITLNAASDQDKIQTCFFNGTITSIDQKKSLVTVKIGSGVSVDASAIEGGDGGGDVTITTPENYFSLNADDIRGNAVVIQDVPSHIFTKLDALDAGCVIYVSGEVTPDVPSAQISESNFETLTKKPYAFIVFSSHEKKIFAYN